MTEPLERWDWGPGDGYAAAIGSRRTDVQAQTRCRDLSIFEH